MLRAVLFDFNGVLVDDEPIHFALFARILGEERIALASGAGDTTGLDDRTSFERALRAAGIVDERALAERVARYVARKSVYYRSEIARHGYPLVPEAVRLAADLAAGGVAIGVVSGALRSEVEGALRATGLSARLAVIVTAEDVVRGKPDPEGYRAALARLNLGSLGADRLVHPHEVAAIEDSRPGLEAAAAAGLRTVGLAREPRAAELRADLVLRSIAELSPGRLRAAFD